MFDDINIDLINHMYQEDVYDIINFIKICRFENWNIKQ